MSGERFDPKKAIGRQFDGDRAGLKGGRLTGSVTHVRYDVRRFETEPGHWVREFTVPVDLTSKSGSVSPDDREQLVRDLQHHLDTTVNQGHELPNGDRLHVRVDGRAVGTEPDDDWTGDPKRAVPVDVHDSTVDKGPKDKLGWLKTDQRNWDVNDPRSGLTHEVMHFLGLGEGYKSDEMLFNRRNQPGVMGNDAWVDSSLTQDNLAKIDEISHGVNIIDHPLGAPAHTPPPALEHTSLPPTPNPTSSHTPAPAPHRSKPVRKQINETPVDVEPGSVVPRDVFHPSQHMMLGTHGVEGVYVGPHGPDNFRLAVRASISPDAPREHARITTALDGARGTTDPDGLANATGLRVHVLNPDGSWTSHGPETGRPVHIVQATVDGRDTYFGTKENVHIGRANLSYPGSTVLQTERDAGNTNFNPDTRKVLHRGEFEVETIRGEHYVRMYTAVLNPAEQGTGTFKDVHQDAEGNVTPFAGAGNAEIFWVGGGRPMRAVQWTAKYETDPNRQEGMQPVLRSFLVPIDTFTKVSREATVEALSQNNLAMNVDQSGDVNQFGLRGEHFAAMRDEALKGSLVTYSADPDYDLQDLAGRREDIADLHARLGLPPDFKSDALGKDNDPWFGWSTDKGRDRAFFRNDPQSLRDLAKKLSDLYHTHREREGGNWDSFFTPPTDSIPDGKPVKNEGSSPEQREKDLNAFLNTRGPAGSVVEQLTDGISDTLFQTLDHGPETVVLDGKAVRNEFVTASKDLGGVVKELINKELRAKHTDPDTGFVSDDARIDSIEKLREVMSDENLVDAVVRGTADQFVKSTLASIGANHNVDTVTDDLTTVVRTELKKQLTVTDGRFRDEIETGFAEKSGSKKNYFAGNRADVVAAELSKGLRGAGIDRHVEQGGLGIDRAVVKERISRNILPDAVSDVTTRNLIGLDPDEIKHEFEEGISGAADKVRSGLDKDAVLKYTSPAHRQALADEATKVLNPDTVRKITFAPVSKSDVDTFMAKVPDYATQAEIGASIATDERRVKVDFNTRVNIYNGSSVDTKTFENTFSEWTEPGHTQLHPEGEFGKHQDIGAGLDTVIDDELGKKTDDHRGAGRILDHLVDRLDGPNPDRHDSLARKYDEVVKAEGKNNRYRTAPKPATNTYREHAQMVLNQYLRLTRGEHDADRFVSRATLVKAILFHDMEKVNSKNQFGEGQARHDQEPEHRGAVEQMNRHEGLWHSERDFRIARAMVDADPFGFYFRGKGGVAAKDVHEFVENLARDVGRPDGKPVTAADVTKLFDEFHQYYQADFSSYFADSHFVHDNGTVQPFGKKSALKGIKEQRPNGPLVTTDNGRRFEYNPDLEQKYQELRKVFEDAERNLRPFGSDELLRNLQVRAADRNVRPEVGKQREGFPGDVETALTNYLGAYAELRQAHGFAAEAVSLVVRSENATSNPDRTLRLDHAGQANRDLAAARLALRTADADLRAWGLEPEDVQQMQDELSAEAARQGLTLGGSRDSGFSAGKGLSSIPEVDEEGPADLEKPGETGENGKPEVSGKQDDAGNQKSGQPDDDPNKTEKPGGNPADRDLRSRLPVYAREGKTLGAVLPVDVRGAKEVGTEIERLVRRIDPLGTSPVDGVDSIVATLDGPGFESFVGSGRRVMIRSGKKWFQVHLKVTLDLDSPGPVSKLTDPMIGDVDATNEVTHAQPNADQVVGTVGSSYSGFYPAGAYASLGATVQPAMPSVEHTSTVVGGERRAIRNAGDIGRADVPVKYTIVVANEHRGIVGSTVDGQVGLLFPEDVGNIVPHTASPDQAPPKPGWAERIEFMAAEYVSVDKQKLFRSSAKLIHPSITRFDAPGRSVLRDFVSGGNVKSSLSTMLQGGTVVSNDLVSPHSTHRDAVRMQARPKKVELYGVVPGDSELRISESTTAGGVTVSASKSGADISASVGAGVYAPGAIGGVAGITGTVSSKVTQSATSGTSVTAKHGLTVKGDTGLYKVHLDVDVIGSSGEKTTIDAVAWVRMGLPEAKAQGLPVPAETGPKFTDPGTRHEPPYLAAAAAAGHVRVGTFTPAAKVQPQIEQALRDRPGFSRFLPRWDKLQGDNLGSSDEVADRLANLRKLTAAFSPCALKSKMDSLLGPGVSVQLKRRGLFTDEFLSVTVKAKLGEGKHLGQLSGRRVEGKIATGTALDTTTTTDKGWSLGVEGRVIAPISTSTVSAGLWPAVTPVQYSDAHSRKNTGGPTIATAGTMGSYGSSDAQAFEHDVEFEVQITSHTRVRPWVRRLTPGSPLRVAPEVSTVGKTGDAMLPKISGKVDLWVSDGVAGKKDPAEFKPGKPEITPLTTSPSIDEVTGADQPEAPKFQHVEAFANSEALRDEALRRLQEAAGGDSVLGLPGSEARNRVDRLFTPEALRADLPKMLEQGKRAGGFRYERRVADRVGALGLGVSLSNPKLVSMADAGGSEISHTGGVTAGSTDSRRQAIGGSAQFAATTRPPGSDAHGQNQLFAGLKWTAWSRTAEKSQELRAGVEKVHRAPTARTVLVQYDADVRMVAESRQERVISGSTSRSGADVKLPGSVYVRMTEDQAREQGILPKLPDREATPGTVDPPSMIDQASSTLGSGVVEDAPDLSKLIREARAELGSTGKRLLPKSVLDDSMNNLQRLLDVTSSDGVTALVGAALDGGVPLQLHDAGLLTTSSHQVLLKATVTNTEFAGVVHDGSELDQVVASATADKQTTANATSIGVEARVAGRGLFSDSGAQVSGYGISYVGQSGTRTRTLQTSTTDSTNKDVAATTTGPFARHRHDVRFELVVRRGDQERVVATQDTRITVRSGADDLKITDGTRPAPPVHAPRTSEVTRADSTPDRIAGWQRGGMGPLPDTAVTESLRGADAVRAGAVRALRLAGAGKGLTGPETGAQNALSSSLRNEMLRALLPDMVDGPLNVPRLHESALFGSGHGSVKVYARLVNPQLKGLSDSVEFEKSDRAGVKFANDAKETSSGERQGNLGGGGVQDPSGNFHGWGGADGRLPLPVSRPTATTGAGSRSTIGKPKGRTGLIGADVEYRVVADLGEGRTAAVEVRVPASAHVRMSERDLEKLLGGPLPGSLVHAQDAVKDAAEKWREAEAALEKAQREADDRWVDQQDNSRQLTKNAGGFGVDTATDPAIDVRQALADAEAAARTAGQRLRDGNTEVRQLEDTADRLLALAATTEEGSPERQDLFDRIAQAQQDAQAVRDARPGLVRQRQEAQDRAEHLADVLDGYRNENSDQRARRDSALTEAGQARQVADETRRKWWRAKQEVDWRIATHQWPRPRIESRFDPRQREDRRESTQGTTPDTTQDTVPEQRTVPDVIVLDETGAVVEHQRSREPAGTERHASVSGADGRPAYTFDVSQVRSSPVTDGSGRVVGVAFTSMGPESDRMRQDWVANNDGAVSSLPRGATSQVYDHKSAEVRGGATPALPGRPFGKWADRTPTPWSSEQGTFFVFAHGSPTAVKLTLLSGEEVEIDGSAFARVVSESTPFAQVRAERNPPSIALLVCSAGQADGPGAVAHDFQQAVDSLAGVTTVHAATEPVITGASWSLVGDAIGSPGAFTIVEDGGRFRTFGGHADDNAVVGLVRDLDQDHGAPPDGPISLSDVDGTRALATTVEKRLLDSARDRELRLTDVADSTGSFTAPYGGGRFRTFEGAPDESEPLARALEDTHLTDQSTVDQPILAGEVAGEPGAMVDFTADSVTTTVLTDHTGTARGLAFGEPAETRRIQSWLTQPGGENFLAEPEPGPAETRGLAIRPPWTDELTAGTTFVVAGDTDLGRATVFVPGPDGSPRAVHVDGATLAQIVAATPGFSQSTSVTLLHDSAARSGLAYDFQAALGQPVHTATGPVRVDAGTTVTDGGHWETLGAPTDTDAVVAELTEALLDGWRYAQVGETDDLVPLTDRAATLWLASEVAKAVSGGHGDDYVQQLLGMHETPAVVAAVASQYLNVVAPPQQPAPAYESPAELEADLRAAAEHRAPSPERAPLLGPDLFGLYQAPEPPDFLRGHDFSQLTAGQGIALIETLDLRRGTPGPVGPADLPDIVDWTIQHTREDDRLTAWAPGDVEALPKVTETPLLMHAIWLGGPLRDAGTMHQFRENFGGAARALGDRVVSVLWTDVPRRQTELALTTVPPAEGPDPLADVRDFVAWARANNVHLVSVDEVFTSENPMLLQEFYLAEAAKQTGPGYAAASDILRMELMNRFGGLYTDGDNEVRNTDDLVDAAYSREGYATHRIGMNVANSAFAMSKGHPFARVHLGVLRDNYGKTQRNLMPAEAYGMSQTFFASKMGRVHRNSIMHRTGPGSLTETARRIGLPSAFQLPGMADVVMNSDASWLKPPPARESTEDFGRAETFELTKRVVQSLVRDLYNRDGDLHLTAVEPAVRRHPDPDLVWHAALSFLAADPDLAPLVRTVTDQHTHQGGLHDVALPPSARALLDIESGREHHVLGEVQHAATLISPDNSGVVTFSDEPTPREKGTEALAKALAGTTGQPAPIEVTGRGPDGRAQAREVAKSLAADLSRALGESHQDVLARVSVKVLTGEGPADAVTVSFRPEGGPEVEFSRQAETPRQVFTGLDGTGKVYEFSADAVVSRPWTHEGRTIGVHYTTDARDVRQDPFLTPAGLAKTAVFDQSVNGTQLASLSEMHWKLGQRELKKSYVLTSAPFAGQESFFVDTHGSPARAQLTILGERAFGIGPRRRTPITVDGPTLARIVTASAEFRQAANRQLESMTLFVCEAGAHLDRGGLGHDFTRQLRDGGIDLPVHMATEPVGFLDPVDAGNPRRSGRSTWQLLGLPGEWPGVSTIVSGGHWTTLGGKPSAQENRRVVAELVRAAELDWWYKPMSPVSRGPIRLDDRPGTLKLLTKVITDVRTAVKHGSTTLDLTTMAADVDRHERPDVVWTAALELAAASRTITKNVRAVMDRRQDPATGWQHVELPAEARALFTVTGKGSWAHGGVVRPMRFTRGPASEMPLPAPLSLAEPGMPADVARWVAEFTVERAGDGLSAPRVEVSGPADVRADLVARLQAALLELTPRGTTPHSAADLVVEGPGTGSVATFSLPAEPPPPALSPADTARAVDLAEEFTLLQLHGVADTVLAKPGPATELLLDLATDVRQGADLGQVADAVEVLDRHGSLDAALTLPGGRSLVRDEVRRMPGRADGEGYAHRLVTAIRTFAAEKLRPDVLREAVRGALDGWTGSPAGFDERLARTRDAVWVMRRFNVVNLAWLDRWRTLQHIREYAARMKEQGERQDALLAELSDAEDAFLESMGFPPAEKDSEGDTGDGE
ncbi:hypothetical protein ACWEOE_00190 [Amycolatopsis sp. NPDC004368]